MNSRDESEKTYKVAVPDNQYVTVFLRDTMSVEEFLASACARKNLNAMEHFVRVKKRRDMEDHNYFVPHRNDLIETYVSINVYLPFLLPIFIIAIRGLLSPLLFRFTLRFSHCTSIARDYD